MITDIASAFCNATHHKLQLPFAIQRAYLRHFGPEPEVRLLPLITDPNRAAIDVGAAEGYYSLFFLSLCSRVICFEPRSNAVSRLRNKFRNANASIYKCALGDTNNTGELNTPYTSQRSIGGWSTLNRNFESVNFKGKPIIGTIKETVEIKTLDSFNFENVGIIKIDVEGHEDSVLRGAERTLRHHSPSVIIEIEQRHRAKPVESAFSILREMHYEGFFLFKNKLLPIANFSLKHHQNLSNIGQTNKYINNFIFLPSQTWIKLKEEGVIG